MKMLSRVHALGSILIGIALANVLFGSPRLAAVLIAATSWLQLWSLEHLRTAIRENRL